jgi:hypothetical protein
MGVLSIPICEMERREGVNRAVLILGVVGLIEEDDELELEEEDELELAKELWLELEEGLNTAGLFKDVRFEDNGLKGSSLNGLKGESLVKLLVLSRLILRRLRLPREEEVWLELDWLALELWLKLSGLFVIPVIINLLIYYIFYYNKKKYIITNKYFIFLIIKQLKICKNFIINELDMSDSYYKLQR